MKRAGAFVFLLCLLSLPVHAALEEEIGTSALIDALPPAAEEAMGELGIESVSPDAAFSNLATYLRGKLGEVLAEALHPVSAIAAVTLLCTAVHTLLPGKKGFDCVNFAGCAAVVALALGSVDSVFALGRQTLTQLSDFSHVLLPTLTAAATAAGAVTSAGAKYAASALFSDVLLMAAERVIFPLIGAYTAAACANAVLGGGLEGPVRFVHWGAKNLMKALATCFTAYLTLTGALSSGADAAAVKATKTALSTLLPVVGRTVADASDALLAGAGLLRSSIGVFGLLAAVGVLALPVLRLAAHCLIYKAAAAVLSMSPAGRISKLINAVGTAYALVLGLVGTAAVILFLSVFSLIKTVGG